MRPEAIIFTDVPPTFICILYDVLIPVVHRSSSSLLHIRQSIPLYLCLSEAESPLAENHADTIRLSLSSIEHPPKSLTQGADRVRTAKGSG
jgi:hypothetical protein